MPLVTPPNGKLRDLARTPREPSASLLLLSLLTLLRPSVVKFCAAFNTSSMLVRLPPISRRKAL